MIRNNLLWASWLIMQVILVLRTSKIYFWRTSFLGEIWIEPLINALPPSLTPLPNKKSRVRACFAFLCLLWEGSDFQLRFTIIFYGIFTVLRSPMWFSSFQKLVWYTNRSVISTQWAKLTCVYQTNMCLYSRMRYANRQLKQRHKHKTR